MSDGERSRDGLPPRGRWNVRTEVSRPENPRVSDLLEPGTDAIPVRISVQQDGFVTGWDDGALGFDDDAVWFSGRATSFRVVAPDVWRFAFRPDEAEAMSSPRLLRTGIPLRHPTRNVWIRIAVLAAAGRRDWEDGHRVAFEIRRLLFSDQAEGESQYPSLSVRPGAKVFDAHEWDLLSRAAHAPAEQDPLQRFFRSVTKHKRIETLRWAIAAEEASS